MKVMTPQQGRTRFFELHAREQVFLLPNPWDVGSAKLLAGAGFDALATTSAGFAWSRGRDDYGVTRDELVEHVRTLAAATELPLNVDSERIESAAAAFPTVDSVELDPNFPHGLRIEVDERPPALLVRSPGREVPVAADGTLLNGVPVGEDEPLPVVEVNEIPAEGSLAGEPLEQALIAGAAPEPLRPLIEAVDHSDETGVTVNLRGDIPVRFGSGARAAEKWAAAVSVLADPKLDALTYVDVRVPERPAAGGAAIAGISIEPPA